MTPRASPADFAFVLGLGAWIAALWLADVPLNVSPWSRAMLAVLAIGSVIAIRRHRSGARSMTRALALSPAAAALAIAAPEVGSFVHVLFSWSTPTDGIVVTHFVVGTLRWIHPLFGAALLACALMTLALSFVLAPRPAEGERFDRRATLAIIVLVPALLRFLSGRTALAGGDTTVGPLAPAAIREWGRLELVASATEVLPFAAALYVAGRAITRRSADATAILLMAFAATTLAARVTTEWWLRFEAPLAWWTPADLALPSWPRARDHGWGEPPRIAVDRHGRERRAPATLKRSELAVAIDARLSIGRARRWLSAHPAPGRYDARALVFQTGSFQGLVPPTPATRFVPALYGRLPVAYLELVFDRAPARECARFVARGPRGSVVSVGAFETDAAPHLTESPRACLCAPDDMTLGAVGRFEPAALEEALRRVERGGRRPAESRAGAFASAGLAEGACVMLDRDR